MNPFSFSLVYRITATMTKVLNARNYLHSRSKILYITVLWIKFWYMYCQWILFICTDLDIRNQIFSPVNFKTCKNTLATILYFLTGFCKLNATRVSTQMLMVAQERLLGQILSVTCSINHCLIVFTILFCHW